MTPHEVDQILERYQRIFAVYKDYMITGDPDKFARDMRGVMSK